MIFLYLIILKCLFCCETITCKIAKGNRIIYQNKKTNISGYHDE